jgi:hypothetical protein
MSDISPTGDIETVTDHWEMRSEPLMPHCLRGRRSWAINLLLPIKLGAAIVPSSRYTEPIRRAHARPRPRTPERKSDSAVREEDRELRRAPLDGLTGIRTVAERPATRYRDRGAAVKHEPEVNTNGLRAPFGGSHPAGPRE